MSTPLGTVGARTTDIPLVLLAVTLAAVAIVLTALRVWATGSLVDVARHETAVVTVVNLLAFVLIFGGVAIGILRYRLLDIDVVINRTTLIAVIQEKMQPAHASLWLRPIASTKEPK